MVVINNIQSDILEHLARFKFLTNSQISRLTSKSIGYIREQVAHLVKIGVLKAYHLEKATKTENLYYLSESGKEVLLQNHKVFAGDIKIPVGVPLVVRDYQHRKNFIDIHIALWKHLQEKGITIEAFYAYFDKTGNNRSAGNLEAKTKIPLQGNDFYIPDGLMITDNMGNKEMYMIEMYNGKDTGRTIEQLAKHARAITLGTPAKKYSILKNPTILCIFEHESSKQAIIKRLQANEHFQPVSKLFFWATLADLEKGVDLAFTDLSEKRLVFS